MVVAAEQAFQEQEAHLQAVEHRRVAVVALEAAVAVGDSAVIPLVKGTVDSKEIPACAGMIAGTKTVTNQSTQQ